MKVLLATHNRKKLAELSRILRPLLPDVEVLGLDDVPAYDEPAETEPSFEGNALLKARVAVRNTGLPSIADDSGLCVEALNGMPGVLSARWAGRDKDDDRNNALLLDQLHDGVTKMKRWGIAQGHGALVGATNGELPVPKAVGAMTSGQTSPEEAARAADAEVTALQKSLQ